MALEFHRKPGLVAYLTCGDPDLETSQEVALAAIAAGADVVELGVPFSDPVADGPVIQRASERALRRGTSLADVLKLAQRLRRQSNAGLIVFSYFNPILCYGQDRFAGEAARAGVDGALVTDLPVEEADEYLRTMRARELHTVFLAAPTSTDERLRAIAEVASGFVYAVSRTGVTGTRQELAGDARRLVERLRRYTNLPIAVGFGISNPQQFAEVGEFADAAVVGSGIVQVMEAAGSGTKAAEAVAGFIRELRAGAGDSRVISAVR
ncbi:MAG TPA: tryptophan synthase subunit alpha [Terriglobales bacterium]|nr:tryptophan synthase subunit alpha [Terriglobales bacterium]